MITVTFTNGPLDGAMRHVDRAPRYLRAIRIVDGGWAVLDGVDDTPASEESVHAYARVAAARYASVDPQPPEAVVRDTAEWQAWCRGALAEAEIRARPARPPEPTRPAAAETFGLPDAAGTTKARRTPPPAEPGQGNLFGGRR